MKNNFYRTIAFKIFCTTVVIAVVLCFSLSFFGKHQYLIMTSNSTGGHDVIMKEMTPLEVNKLRKVNTNAIIEKDIIVTGLENNINSNKANDKSLKGKVSHEKHIVKGDVNNSSYEWNMQQINIDTAETSHKNSNSSNTPIKVCIIDSGIDYNPDIDVYARKNFIPGQDDMSIIYEDTCGHGTNVAGIIAAKNNDEGVTGINPNVLLYSAKVLDTECSAPVSRIIEAINWAISQKVNIINISFGTTSDSEALHQAIRDANDAGILIIAAAGNNGQVEYPANYSEVMAVGSVDSQGNISSFSPDSNKVELVAPGELVLSTGDFGGLSVHSGTSLSAPHVAGIASVLWEMDRSVSASFIRSLLDTSANLYDASDAYGYGLVDLNYALSIYDSFKETYNKNSSLDSKSNLDNAYMLSMLEQNTSSIKVFDNESYVEGSWLQTYHSGTVSNSYITALKTGATANDIYIEGMTTHPQWHGYWKRTVSPENSTLVYKSNYLASYMYLTKMALQFRNTTSYTDPPIITGMPFDDFYYGLGSQVSSTEFCYIPWSTVLGNTTESNLNKSYFMYGVAIHSAADAFAHSTYTLSGGTYSYISHGSGYADNPAYPTSSRSNCAYTIAQSIITKAINGQLGSISEFYNALVQNYDHSFYMGNISTYANAIDPTYYGTHSSLFDEINVNVDK